MEKEPRFIFKKNQCRNIVVVHSLDQHTVRWRKYLRMQCLASSKILTPNPLSIQRVCLPPYQRHSPVSPGGEGGGEVFWKTPGIGLASYCIIALRLEDKDIQLDRRSAAVFSPIEFNPACQISNYLQFNCTPYTI